MAPFHVGRLRVASRAREFGFEDWPKGEPEVAGVVGDVTQRLQVAVSRRGVAGEEVGVVVR